MPMIFSYMKKSQNKELFKIRTLHIRQAFLPISFKLDTLMDSHDKLLHYLGKKVSTFEDISRQVQFRLDALFERMRTINLILLLYGVALSAICITLLFI